MDVVPFVEAELNRRFPGRAARRAGDPDGLRAAWAVLERTWAETLARVAAMPAGTVDISVDGEWSFAQTLRHLVMATDTVWMRSREVWMHAVDLANGAAFRDIPVPVLERLLKDITGAWKTRGTDAGLVVKVTDRDLTCGDTASASPTVVSGPLADVVEWAAGRGRGGVTAAGPGTEATNGAVPAAPKWI